MKTKLTSPGEGVRKRAWCKASLVLVSAQPKEAVLDMFLSSEPVRGSETWGTREVGPEPAQ